MDQMPFQLTILGSSSATPTSNRYPTAQVLNVLGRFFLIDCGEGTQHQIRKNNISLLKINNIFISHLHGDHFFGLIGIIATMGLMGRKTDLHIYAHSELQKYTASQIKYLKMEDLGYQLIFHPLNFKKPQTIFENKKIIVKSFPLKHRIDCCGFRFDEKPREPNIIKEQIDCYNIPIRSIKDIKAGEDFVTKTGDIIPNSKLVREPLKPRSYAFCSDTCYFENIIEQIKKVDLLYHEATFAEAEKDLAEKTFHSTAIQAAKIASLAKVKKLLIGHFSARYNDTKALQDEARTIFRNSFAVKENRTYSVRQSKKIN